MDIIWQLNFYRKKYLETKDKIYCRQMIQLLPTSYNQKYAVTMNYEDVINIISQREGHKLDEWNDFCNFLKLLPYVEQIIDVEEKNNGQ